MHTETEYLRILAVETTAKPIQESPDEKPDKHLVAEADRVQKLITSHLLSIDNFPQRESFYFNTQTNLIDICDILYKKGDNVTPDVIVLLELMAAIRKVLPTEISPSLNLPRAFVHIQKEKLTEICKLQQQIFKEQQVDPKLIKIATIPFRLFINGKQKLYWRNFTWLKGFEEKLDNIDWENADCNSKTEAVMSLLLNCDFNDDRFFIYCKKYIIERTNKFGTKKRRLAEFAECEKLIMQDTLDEFPPYNYRRPNISKKLIDWIGIEIKAIKANDSFDDELYKIEFNLDVDSLALFWKHLMDHGITKQVNVDLYSKQIAATCSSKGKEEVTWKTIKAKFYGRAPKYLRRIYDPLTAIIQDMRRFLKT